MGQEIETTAATASPAQLTAAWASIDLGELRSLPAALDDGARLDDRQFELVEQIAALPLPPLEPCPERHFLQCMRALRTLPARGDDDISGELRLNLLIRHFAHMPKSAIDYLAQHATIECRFFPTPAECEAILKRWRRTDGPSIAKAKAERLACDERQARFEELRSALLAKKIPGSGLVNLSAQLIRIGEENRVILTRPNGAVEYWTPEKWREDVDARKAELAAYKSQEVAP